MAPVVNIRAALDHATGITRHTLAVVETLKLKEGNRVRYQSCNGFIVHALNGRVYVAVHKKKLAKLTSQDVIGVRFQNNMQEEARIFTNILDLTILEIVVPGNFEGVNIGNLPCDRTDVFIIAQAKMEDELQFNSYTSSVINPSNEFILRGKFKPLVFQSPDFFTIGWSANMEIDRIIGAPVFNLDGIFLGIIHSFHEDMVFVRSSHFISGIRTEIEMKN